MNCTRCNIELPDNAQFCPQCGNPATSMQIFPPDPHDQRQASSGSIFLIGCAGVAGALILFAMLVGFVLLDEEPLLHDISLDHTFEIGSDFNLYGKTLNGEEFDWENFRGKYVLVKFTATWCGPCKGKIPGMLDAYEKYHDRGFEIVSVYIWEQQDNTEIVKQYVESEKLPWIIISEPLTKESGQPPQGKTFGIEGVPTMLLVDKEGKVLPPTASLMQELKKLYGK